LLSRGWVKCTRRRQFLRTGTIFWKSVCQCSEKGIAFDGGHSIEAADPAIHLTPYALTLSEVVTQVPMVMEAIGGVEI
jgi:hypothetical protein